MVTFQARHCTVVEMDICGSSGEGFLLAGGMMTASLRLVGVPRVSRSMGNLAARGVPDLLVEMPRSLSRASPWHHVT
jgi:hypothetical protein